MQLGDFPLKHFWGPLANIKSTAWIVDSAIIAAREERPDFFYIYLPHLDYAAQKFGPDSAEAKKSLGELDEQIGKLAGGFARSICERDEITWIVASEYAIVPVDHVLYPNRMLREAGLLKVREEADGEHLDFAASRAWALVDHQFSHIFVQPGDAQAIDEVRRLFTDHVGVAECLVGDATGAISARSRALRRGDPDFHAQQLAGVLLVARRCASAGFARTVDIHRKPGYDPVELFFDPATRSIPLNADLVTGFARCAGGARKPTRSAS